MADNCLSDVMKMCGNGGYDDMGYESYQHCFDAEAEQECGIEVSG